MANYAQINATGPVVVYELEGKTKVNSAGVVVLYGLEGAPTVRVGAVGAVVLYSLAPDIVGVQANATGVVAVYSEAPPSKRIFPVPPPKRQLQSQIGKRKFPPW
jgi:hypothetical protein